MAPFRIGAGGLTKIDGFRMSQYWHIRIRRFEAEGSDKICRVSQKLDELFAMLSRGAGAHRFRSQ